jgi:hypothetical protein
MGGWFKWGCTDLLSGNMLWWSEYLKNWQRRGAIHMEKAFNAILLDL